MDRIKAPFAYLGGKHLLGPRIAALLPKSGIYCEPFCGMASVFFARDPPSDVSILSDSDNRIVHFLRTLRDYPSDLIRYISGTPCARSEFESALKQNDPDPIVRAGQTAMILGNSMTSSLECRDRDFGANRKTAKDISPRLALCAARLLRVKIENDPADKIIRRLSNKKDVVLYCDPPYLGPTTAKKYGQTMTEADHASLLDLLVTVQGCVAISGYASDLYNTRLARWRRIEWEHSTQLGLTRGKRTEILWMNF